MLFLSLITERLCTHSLSWEEHLVPIGRPLVSALLSTQPLLGTTRDQGGEFSLSVGHSMTVSYYDTKNLNLVLRKNEAAKAFLVCTMCLIRIQGNVSGMEGLKGS